MLSLLGASLGLLLDVGLSATLQGLASVVLLLVLSLSSLVARDASNSTTDSARDTIANAGAQVRELTAGLLLLALEVLLTACTLKVLRKFVVSLLSHGCCRRVEVAYLRSDQPANSLLCRADGLVPRSSGAVGVVLSDA